MSSKFPEVAIQTPNGVRYFRTHLADSYKDRSDCVVNPTHFPGMQLHHLKIEQGTIVPLTEEEKAAVKLDPGYIFEGPNGPLAPQDRIVRDPRFEQLSTELNGTLETLKKHVELTETALKRINAAHYARFVRHTWALKRAEKWIKILVAAAIVSFVLIGRLFKQ